MTAVADPAGLGSRAPDLGQRLFTARTAPGRNPRAPVHHRRTPGASAPREPGAGLGATSPGQLRSHDGVVNPPSNQAYISTTAYISA